MASPSLDLLVRKLATHTTLPDDDRQALLALPFISRQANPSVYLVREGEHPGTCAVLMSGYAFRHKVTGDGNRQIVSLHVPGDALDFQNLFLDAADHNVQTLTHVHLAVVQRAAVREIFQARPNVARAIVTAILVEESIAREWLLNVGRRDARARLAHLLCEFATRLDAQGLSAGGYELPMTQEQLGDALGLTAVHVNRTIKTLEADGLITRKGRMLSFPNIAALRHEGDFSSLYLHREQQNS